MRICLVAAVAILAVMFGGCGRKEEGPPSVKQEQVPAPVEQGEGRASVEQEEGRVSGERNEDVVPVEQESKKANMPGCREASGDVAMATDLGHKDAETYFNRGNEKFGHYDYKGAIVDYTKAIELDPRHAGAYNNRGNAKLQLGDRVGACEDWRRAGELGNENVWDLIKNNCQ